MPRLTCPVPETVSTINPNGFMFSIQKYPELTYFVQEVQLPGISLGAAMFASSSHDIRMPGEAMEFDDLQVQFLIDEKMENYQAIQQWIMGLGFPEGNKMYREFMAKERNAQGLYESSKAVSDCSLTILNNNNQPVKRIEFVNAWPNNLSAMTFQSTNTDVNYLVATVSLTYSYYNIG